ELCSGFGAQANGGESLGESTSIAARLACPSARPVADGPLDDRHLRTVKRGEMPVRDRRVPLVTRKPPPCSGNPLPPPLMSRFAWPEFRCASTLISGWSA